MTDRREFLKQTCALCAAAAGLGFLVTQLDSCKPTEGLKVTVTKSQITVPLKAFGDQKNYLVKDFSLPYDILVVKYPDNTYGALQMRCTHKSYALRVTPTGLVCDNHGSEFNFNGEATKQPASMPLRKYPCSVENKLIVVNLNG